MFSDSVFHILTTRYHVLDMSEIVKDWSSKNDSGALFDPDGGIHSASRSACDHVSTDQGTGLQNASIDKITTSCADCSGAYGGGVIIIPLCSIKQINQRFAACPQTHSITCSDRKAMLNPRYYAITKQMRLIFLP